MRRFVEGLFGSLKKLPLNDSLISLYWGAGGARMRGGF